MRITPEYLMYLHFKGIILDNGCKEDTGFSEGDVVVIQVKHVSGDDLYLRTLCHTAVYQSGKHKNTLLGIVKVSRYCNVLLNLSTMLHKITVIDATS